MAVEPFGYCIRERQFAAGLADPPELRFAQFLLHSEQRSVVRRALRRRNRTKA
jgi:hypothetical protein